MPAYDTIQTLPFVTIGMPCLNEAGYIEECLRNALGQEYPSDRLEVHIAARVAARVVGRHRRRDFRGRRQRHAAILEQAARHEPRRVEIVERTCKPGFSTNWAE